MPKSTDVICICVCACHSGYDLSAQMTKFANSHVVCEWTSCSLAKDNKGIQNSTQAILAEMNAKIRELMTNTLSKK